MKEIDSSPEDTTDVSDLVAAYIARYANMYSHDNGVFIEENINFWAYENMLELVRHHPDKALVVILEILASTEDEFVLSNLAAGPLEDLLRIHGASVIAEIEQRAKQDCRFSALLWQVYKVTPDDIWERIEAVRTPA
jgi:hypothetical protein